MRITDIQYLNQFDLSPDEITMAAKDEVKKLIQGLDYITMSVEDCFKLIRWAIIGRKKLQKIKKAKFKQEVEIADDWISIRQAIKISKYSRGHLYDLCRKLDIVNEKRRNRVLISKKSLIKYLNNGQKKED